MKKLLAALLAVILLTQAVPLTVLAAEEGETAPKSAEKIIRMGEPVAAETQGTGDREYSTDRKKNEGESDSGGPLKTSGRGSTSKLSVEDLRRRIDAIPNVGKLYEEKPVVSGPGYRPAVLTEEAYANALGWINYYRTAAGLREVAFTDELNLSASWGALCLAMAGQLTHSPERPEDMSEEDFERGRDAAASSTLSWSWGYGSGAVLQEAVAGQIADSDSANISTLGHRRWLLDPRIRTMGAGVADGDGYYTAVRVMGGGVSTQAVTDYDFISWPASGNNLSETFLPDTAWSVTLNPSRYMAPDPSAVKVTLTRKSDGRTWTFGSTTDTSQIGTEYDYFAVNTRGYGIANCIIFRPACSDLPAYSGVYTVDITGIFDRDGNETPIHYPAVFSSYGADGSRRYRLDSWAWEDDWSAAWATFVFVHDPSISMTLEAEVTGPADGIYTAEITGPEGDVYTCSERAFDPPAFRSQALVLSGQIGVKFYLELPEIEGVDYGESYMTFSVGRDTALSRADFNEGDRNASGRYGFTCRVNSLQMADTIRATFHYGNGWTASKEYSVEQYIQAAEANSERYGAKTMALIRAIADYGHYSQIYLADVNHWSAGDRYTEMTTYYTDSFDYASILAAVSGMAFDKSGIAGTDVEKAAYRLILDSETTLDVYLTPKNGTVLTASASFNGAEYTAARQPDGRYLVRIPNIPAHRLGEMITVSGKAGGTFTVRVSALSYVRSVLNSAASNGAAKDGLSALYQYCAAVLAYRA